MEDGTSPQSPAARPADDEGHNPFEILGVPATAGTREVEREGQRRLAMIAAGIADDSGTAAEHRVRRALDELRDARRRLAHEIRAPALCAADVAGSELAERIETLAGTLPKSTPSSYALAEALLFAAVDWPPPFVLPPDHADERARAFSGNRAIAGEEKLVDTLDWGELVAFQPPRKAPKSQRPKSEPPGKKKG